MAALERDIGDYTYRGEKRTDGTWDFSRRLRNTPGAQFEDVPCLNDVPPQLLTGFREWQARQAQNQADGSQGQH